MHGRGFATEAAQAVLDVCFNTLGAHRVYAQLDARNEASARLCERLGMHQEALLRENEIFKGELEQHRRSTPCSTRSTAPADRAEQPRESAQNGLKTPEYTEILRTRPLRGGPGLDR